MQQLTVTAPQRLEWRDVPAPVLDGPGAAVVAPVAVSTCDFDHLIVGGRTPSLPLPIAIGHEFVATVVKTGDGVQTVAPGDTVLVTFQVACGACDACRRGHTSSCREVPWLSCYGLGTAGGGYGGAMSELVGVPYADAMLVPLPDGVSPADAAAASCNIPDAYRCVVPQLAQWPGAPVLVAGGAFGNIALYAVALALAHGASRVDYLDRDPRRAARAAQLGARVLDEPGDAQPGGYPVTVDASQDVELLGTVLRATAPDGTCTASTMYPEPTTAVPLMEMFARCVTLRTGQPHVRAHVEPVLGLIAGGTLRPARLTDAVVGWDDAPDAFRAGTGKVVCTREHAGAVRVAA